MKAIIVAFFILFTFVHGDDSIFLAPIKNGTKVGLVFVQGAQITTKAYVPLIRTLQEQSSFAISAVIPAFVGDTPEPLQMAGNLRAAISTLHDKGLPKDAPIFGAAHSLGGVMLQNYVAKNPSLFKALILTGSGILRSHRADNGTTTFPVKTLTVGGTLDGLYRITRNAENYYHQVQNSKDIESVATTFPVILVEGVSHLQFASGAPPALVKKMDLKPTISESEAHSLISKIISSYLNAFLTQDPNAITFLDGALKDTGVLVQPIISALELEAFKHFRPPCNTDFASVPSRCTFYPKYPTQKKPKKGINQANCVCGTPWVELHAQSIMAGLNPEVNVVTTDAIHSVSDVTPVHLPHIWESSPTRINVTTVTQAIYPTLDGFDTGFTETAALELRVKLKSRESMHIAAGMKNVNFTKTDVVTSNCAEINKVAIEWAFNHSSPSALQHFAKVGESIAVGEDIFKGNVGPLWIYNPLKLLQAKGNASATVEAPCSHTPVNYKIKAAAGYHYCKLLSPARALEWIYVDGLRAHGGI